MVDISQKSQLLNPSKTAEVFALAREMEHRGEKIIHLEAGQSELPVPSPVLESVKDNLVTNTGYTIGRGLLELRQSISDYYLSNFTTAIDPGSEIIIVPGAKYGLFASLSTLLNPGDEIVITTPAWTTYFDLAKYFQATIQKVPLQFSRETDIPILRKAVTKKTKLLLINFPNNPTGITVSKAYLSDIVSIIIENPRLVLLSDEIYAELVHEEVLLHSMLEFSIIKDRLIVVSGFSKTYAMTGFRIGYVIGPSMAIDQIFKLITSSITCVPSFIQLAAIQALRLEKNYYIERREHYKKKLELVTSLFGEREQLDAIRIPFNPNACFYIFIECVNGSPTLAGDLLTATKVATIPGSAFGSDYSNFIRISYTISDVHLVEGITRILKYIDQIHPN